MKDRFLNLFFIGLVSLSASIGLLVLSSKLPTQTPFEMASAPQKPLAYRNDIASESTQSNGRFIDISFSMGIDHTHLQSSKGVSDLKDSFGGGACVADFDNDGWMDLLFITGSGTTRFYGRQHWWSDHKPFEIYKNNQGHFQNLTDRTQFDKAQNNTATFGCAVADFNLDGLSDLIVFSDGTDTLYQNEGDFVFTPTTSFSQASSKNWTSHALLLDANRDGLMDVYLSRYIDYKKNIRRFESATGYGPQSSNHFDPSIFDGLSNQLLINRGNFNFIEEKTLLSGKQYSERTLSSQWARTDSGEILILNANGDKQALRLTSLISSPLSSGQKSLFTGDEIFNTSLSGIRFLKRSANNENDFFAARGSGLSDLTLSIKGNELAFRNLGNAHKTAYTETWSWLESNQGLIQANSSNRRDTYAPLNSIGQVDLCYRPIQSSQISHDYHGSPCDWALDYPTRSLIKLDIDNDGKQELIVVGNNAYPLIFEPTDTSENWINLHIPVEKMWGGHLEMSYGNHTITRLIEFDSVMLGQSSPRIHHDLPDKSSVTVRLFDPYQKLVHSEQLSPNKHYLFNNTNWQEQVFTGQNSKLEMIKDSISITDLLKLLHHSRLNKQDLDVIKAKLRKTLPDEQADLSSHIFSSHASEHLLPVYQTLIEEPSPHSLQLAGVNALRDLEEERSIYLLLKQLQSANAEKFCALSELFSHWFHEEEAVVKNKGLAIPYFMKYLESDQASIRDCAIRALSTSDDKTAAQTLLRFDDKTISLAYIDALGHLRHTHATSKLRDLISMEESAEYVAEALLAYERLHPKKALPLLKQRLEVSNNDSGHKLLRDLIQILSQHKNAKLIKLSRLKEWARHKGVDTKTDTTSTTQTLPMTESSSKVCMQSDIATQKKLSCQLIEFTNQQGTADQAIIKLIKLDKQEQKGILQDVYLEGLNSSNSKKLFQSLSQRLLTQVSLNKDAKDFWSQLTLKHSNYSRNWLASRLKQDETLLDQWLQNQDSKESLLSYLGDAFSLTELFDNKTLSKETRLSLAAHYAFENEQDGLKLLETLE